MSEKKENKQFTLFTLEKTKIALEAIASAFIAYVFFLFVGASLTRLFSSVGAGLGLVAVVVLIPLFGGVSALVFKLMTKKCLTITEGLCVGALFGIFIASGELITSNLGAILQHFPISLVIIFGTFIFPGFLGAIGGFVASKILSKA